MLITFYKCGYDATNQQVMTLLKLVDFFKFCWKHVEESTHAIKIQNTALLFVGELNAKIFHIVPLSKTGGFMSITSRCRMTRVMSCWFEGKLCQVNWMYRRTHSCVSGDVRVGKNKVSFNREHRRAWESRWLCFLPSTSQCRKRSKTTRAWKTEAEFGMICLYVKLPVWPLHMLRPNST